MLGFIQSSAFRRKRNTSDTGMFPLEVIDRLRSHLDPTTRARLRCVSRDIKDALDSNLPAAVDEFARFRPCTLPRLQAFVPTPETATRKNLTWLITGSSSWRMASKAWVAFAAGYALNEGWSLLAGCLCALEAGLLAGSLWGPSQLDQEHASNRLVALTEQRVMGLKRRPDDHVRFLNDVQLATRRRLACAHQALKMLPALVAAQRFQDALVLVLAMPSDMLLPEPLAIAVVEQALDITRHTSAWHVVTGHELSVCLEKRGDLTARSPETMRALRDIAANSLGPAARVCTVRQIEHRLRLCRGALPHPLQLRQLSRRRMGAWLREARSKHEFPMVVTVAERIVDHAIRTGGTLSRDTVEQLIRLEVLTMDDLLSRAQVCSGDSGAARAD